MPRSHADSRRNERATALYRSAAIAIAAWLLVIPGSTPSSAAGPSDTQLHLEVIINGEPTKLIGGFTRRADGSFACARGELGELGIAVPGRGKDEEAIPLASLDRVSFRYDEAAQKMEFTLPVSALATKTYSQRGRPAARPGTEVSSDFGVLANYNLFASAGRTLSGLGQFSKTANVTLDARAFSPLGVAQSSGIVGTNLTKDDFIRLETSYSYFHRDSALLGRAGDGISGGLSWTRPVRYGGLGLSRDFTMRPDLVTVAMPSLSGTAAVPSTIDVLIGNNRIASQQVGAGPYRITDLPMSGTNGTARVVVRDVTGKETLAALPFFSSARLLSAGTADFSFDAGVPRFNYATNSFDYGRTVFGMASARYGLTDYLTLEAHGEGMKGLANGGLGLVLGTGQFGIFTLAGAGSWTPRSTGGLVYAGWERQFQDFFVAVGTQRRISSFEDVASVTAPAVVNTRSTLPGYFGIFNSTRVSQAQDYASISYMIPQNWGSIAANVANVRRDDGQRSTLVGLSYGNTFNNRYNVFLAAHRDLSHGRSFTISAGLSFPFDDDIRVSASLDKDRYGVLAGMTVSRNLGNETYDYGWRLSGMEGRTRSYAASGAFRAPQARAEGGLRIDNNTASGFGEVDGAIVATPSGVLLGNRVNDAFAIVDAGAPGVVVLHENRPVGETGWFGSLLVPNLQSFHPAKLAIQPDSLPADLLTSTTETEVIPNFRGSATLNIKSTNVTRDTALIEVRAPGGGPFTVGTRVKHLETGNDYAVGYDGTIFLTGLETQNTLTVATGTSICTATFARGDRDAATGRYKPVTCRMEGNGEQAAQ
jgi:outer membrane usher protein